MRVFEEATIEVLSFNVEDVITASTGGNGGNGGDYGDEDEF